MHKCLLIHSVFPLIFCKFFCINKFKSISWIPIHLYYHFYASMYLNKKSKYWNSKLQTTYLLYCDDSNDYKEYQMWTIFVSIIVLSILLFYSTASIAHLVKCCVLKDAFILFLKKSSQLTPVFVLFIVFYTWNLIWLLRVNLKYKWICYAFHLSINYFFLLNVYFYRCLQCYAM